MASLTLRRWFLLLLPALLCVEAARPADVEDVDVLPRGMLVRPQRARHVQARHSQTNAASLADVRDLEEGDEPGGAFDDDEFSSMSPRREARAFDPAARVQASHPTAESTGEEIADDRRDANADGAHEDEFSLLPDVEVNANGHREDRAPNGHRANRAVFGMNHASLDHAVAVPHAGSEDHEIGGSSVGDEAPIENKDLFKATAAESSSLKEAAETINTKIHSVDQAIDKVHGAMETYHKSINGLSHSFGDLRSRAKNMRVGLDGEFEERERQRLCSFENVERVMRGEAFVPCDKTTRLATDNGVHAERRQVREAHVVDLEPAHELDESSHGVHAERRQVSEPTHELDERSPERGEVSEDHVNADEALREERFITSASEGAADEEAADSEQAPQAVVPAPLESASANLPPSDDSAEGVDAEGVDEIDGHKDSAPPLLDIPSSAHEESSSSPLFGIPSSAHGVTLPSSPFSLLEIPSSAEAQDQQDELDAELPEWVPDTRERQRDVLW